MKLTERWQKVIEQNGQYIIDQCLLFLLINFFENHKKKRNDLVANPIIINKDFKEIITTESSIEKYS